MTDLSTAYGSRGRVGLILPADNVTMEPEIYSLGIPGVSFNTLRLTATDHHEMRRQATELSSTIYELGLDAIVYACAETSFNDGSDTSQRLTDILTEKSQLPITTATNAMLAALEHFGAQQLAVVSPYSARSGLDLETTLTANGYHVVSAIHHDFLPESGDPRVWYATNRQPKDITLSLLKQIDVTDADTILLPSTNWPTLAVIDQIEQSYGKRVVGSNQSILWWVLQTLGIEGEGGKLGRLGAPTVRAQ